MGDYSARGLGGVARSPKDLESKDQRIQKVELKGSKDERSKDSYKDSRYQGLKEFFKGFKDSIGYLTAWLPQGASGTYVFSLVCMYNVQMCVYSLCLMYVHENGHVYACT